MKKIWNKVWYLILLSPIFATEMWAALTGNLQVLLLMLGLSVVIMSLGCIAVLVGKERKIKKIWNKIWYSIPLLLLSMGSTWVVLTGNLQVLLLAFGLSIVILLLGCITILREKE